MPNNPQTNSAMQAHARLIKRYLEGVKYPANKNQLADYAKQQQAPSDLINVLQQLPASEFGSPNTTRQTEYKNIDELLQEIEKID